MRVTNYPPFRSVSHDEYQEELKNPLALENLIPGESQVARFLHEAPEKRGLDYRVKIGEIALRLKRRLWVPQSFRLYPAVKLQPVSLDDKPIGGNSYDIRPVNGRGLIYAKDKPDKVVGYFVQSHDEPEFLDEKDIGIMTLINDPQKLAPHRPKVTT